MSDQEKLDEQEIDQEPSMFKTVLWIFVGLLIYISIQWMLPKVGGSS